MIPLTHAAGRRVAVFGLGGSGLSTAQALVAGKAEVVAWDDNPDSVAKAEKAGIETGNLRGLDWSGVDALALAPGVPLTHPRPHWSVELARTAGVEIIGDVELFFRERRHVGPRAKVLAITGTNGKSTTTALAAHVLKTCGLDVQMGGNIGKAVLTLDPFAPGRVYVVEVSSYQIDLSPTLDPDVGVLLNLSPDHLDRHGTFERYAAIKERLVSAARHAVVGTGDAASRAIAERHGHAQRVSLDPHPTHDGWWADEKKLFYRERGIVSDEVRWSRFPALPGRHNATNMLTVFLAVPWLETHLGTACILEGFETFPGLAHRLERVGRVGDVLFVNDSKGTNPDAAATALSSFPKVFWIAGGLPKEGGIEPLAPLFERVEKAYLIGEAAPAFAATLGASTVPYQISGTVEAAVNHALADARGSKSPATGDAVVLLSPACASFDQFRNFEERGEAFRRAIESLDGFTPL